MPARCYDPLLSIIWQGSRDNRRFHEISQKAHAQDHYLPPRVKARLLAVSPTGEVQPVQASFTITHQAFNVVCEGNVVYRVHLRIPIKGHADKSRWPVEKYPCTCGVPSIGHMPCGHMLAVAFSMSISSTYLVPTELTTGHWRAQFPAEELAIVPTLSDVVGSATARNNALHVPVTAPPKRGRPNNKRKRSAIEKVTRNLRTNAGN